MSFLFISNNFSLKYDLKTSKINTPEFRLFSSKEKAIIYLCCYYFPYLNVSDLLEKSGWKHEQIVDLFDTEPSTIEIVSMISYDVIVKDEKISSFIEYDIFEIEENNFEIED